MYIYADFRGLYRDSAWKIDTFIGCKPGESYIT